MDWLNYQGPPSSALPDTCQNIRMGRHLLSRLGIYQSLGRELPGGNSMEGTPACKTCDRCFLTLSCFAQAFRRVRTTVESDGMVPLSGHASLVLPDTCQIIREGRPHKPARASTNHWEGNSPEETLQSGLPSIKPATVSFCPISLRLGALIGGSNGGE